jgi:hypothetical protein
MVRHRTRLRLRPRLARQRGQALIFGLFVMVAGLTGVFFMFNTGQLTAEKTKLVNTADAVAYSAAVMHARALNFDAYTNRALMANEVLVAQMVSVSSWLEYAEEHNQRVTPLNCTYVYSVPIVLVLVKYEPLCALMAWQYAQAVIQPAKQGFDAVGQATMTATETAKAALQASQAAMFAAFLPARTTLMQQVADANYAGLGPVKVDAVPLLDNYSLFDGAPFIRRYAGNERTRFKAVEERAAYTDAFVASRGWSDSSPWPCFLGLPSRGNASHTASTTLNGFDSWTARDDGRLGTEIFVVRLFSARCRSRSAYNLGDGRQTASKSGGDWYYSGVPSFYDLSAAALGYTPENSDAGKRDNPRLQFAIRLTRGSAALRTSSGTSLVKPTGQMAIYQGAEANDVMAAVASSEVFFERPVARADGKTELASLFNPYWQAHLIGNPAGVRAAALALQNP